MYTHYMFIYIYQPEIPEGSIDCYKLMNGNEEMMMGIPGSRIPDGFRITVTNSIDCVMRLR